MSDKLSDLVELFHERGIYIPTKTIRMTGDVDQDMFDQALANLHSLDSKTGDITIKLMTDGGCLASARGIYDLIRGCKNRVRIICYGEVSSAGTVILQAADTRIMASNSKIMIHVGSEGIASDHPRNVDALYTEHRIDEKWLEDVYLAKIKEKKKRFTRKQMKDVLTWDKYMSPKEALELGLIDEIGEIQ